MLELKSKTPIQLRKFGLTMAVPLLLLWGLAWWRNRPLTADWLLGFAIGFLVLALVYPRGLAPIEKAWMALAGVLSVVVTYIILTLTFFLVITPFGLIMRLFGADLLKLKFDRKRTSYWDPVDPDGPAGHPERPF